VSLLLERCFAGGVVAAAMDIATRKGVFPSKDRQFACWERQKRLSGEKDLKPPYLCVYPSTTVKEKQEDWASGLGQGRNGNSMTGIATALPVLKGSILAFSKVANRGTILPQSILVPRITVFHTQNNLSFSASPCSTGSLHNPSSLWLSGRELDSGRKLLGRVRARLCHASTRTAAEVSNIMKSASTSTKVTTNP
jgi:hypothetical protein